MNKPERTNQVQSGIATERTAKKRYQKPAVRYERVFETTALTCGKVRETERQCHFNRKVS